MVLIKDKLLQSATYLVDNYIIDCGDGDAILKIAKESNLEIRVFLTHCYQEQFMAF